MSKELLALAWHYHAIDDYARSEQLCRQALQADGQNQEAWRLLGEVCLFQSKAAEATQGLQQALQLGPLPAEGHNNLGVALAKQGRLEEAVGHYLQAVQLKPTYVECYNNLGVAMTDLARPAEAVAYLRRALDLNPNYPLAHNSLGIALAALGQLDEAQASYHQALRLRPNYANAYNNLGIALAAQGKLDEAVASYHQALRFQADNVSALNALGAALAAQGKLDEAVASYEQARQSDPEYAETYNNAAVAHMQQGALDEAVAGYAQALQRKPEYADAHKNLSMALLLKGDLERGWREYEWRWRCKDFSLPPYAQPIWDGSSLRGRTLLLQAEQGLGDTLQFIRYASLLQQQGGTVVAACQKALLPVLANCPGVDALVNRDGPLPPFDVYAPLLSLPRILGTTLESVPAEVPYLFANPQLVDHWRERLREIPGFKIGINWHGRPGHGIWRQRNIPLSQFAELARLPGVQLISLQKGAGRDELSAVRDQFPVVDLGDEVDEAHGAFTDTAAIMLNLDLVITSDTAVPHLAGALGVPVWVALPFAACWRWLLQREDSPWYPTMRLFRQTEFGNWSQVFSRLLSAVRQQLTATSRMEPIAASIGCYQDEQLAVGFTAEFSG
ncbi:MAG: tetratricopeptide repeat protein [Planctomycetota bacterium]|nr:tetratricopeptide repeat protein [Planctomycetota bacterium]